MTRTWTDSKHRMAALHANPVFAGCTRRELAAVDRLGVAIEVAAGRTLIREGNPGRECFITLAGTAVAWHDGRPVGAIGPGSVVGEAALLRHVPRNATVVTRTPMRLLVLDAREFERLLTIAPSAAAALERIASDRQSEPEPEPEPGPGTGTGGEARTRRLGVRTLTVALILTVVGLAIGGRAGADQPVIVTTRVNVSFTDDYLSDVCGVEVRFFHVGTLSSKLSVDSAGSIVREIDTTRGDTFGWESPTTGRSVVFPNGSTLVTEYPNGATVGSPATVSGFGVSLKVPGLPADAGKAVFLGHVAFIDPDGVPIVAFDRLLSIRGTSNDPAHVDAAICAALS